MVLDFSTTLHHALTVIEAQSSKEFIVHAAEEEKTFENACSIVELHGSIKWQIIDLLNEHYQTNFCLSHWLHSNEDEVSSFLNEAGSNVLSHSTFKAPYQFLLWLGKKGFILGIQQKGSGFPAEDINQHRIKDNEGRAFDFFRQCQQTVFFDDSKDARIVYFQYLF